MQDSVAPSTPKRTPGKGSARVLADRYAGLDGADLLRPLIETEFSGRIALVSSFGTESAVLLALAAEVDPGLPIIFIDTLKLFGETKRYRDTLAQRLGLTNIVTVQPDRGDLEARDRDDLLFQRDPDGCCHIRKVLPLERALTGYSAWITGRKRFQSTTRAAIEPIEFSDGRFKINPLATWSRERIETEFDRRDLPRHPLEADGFLSIGCMPCTTRVSPGEDVRAGRWAGMSKTECGIHSPIRSSAQGIDR